MSVISNIKRSDLPLNGALLYVFLIPFHQQIASIAIIVWALLSIIGHNKSSLVKNHYLLLLPLAYLSYSLGFFTSETLSFKFLETKLSLLVFPLVFFLNPYSKSQRMRIMKYLVLGLTSAGLICLLVATYKSITIDEGSLIFKANILEGRGFIESILYGGNYYFGRFFSIFHQTVYFALYLCTGVAVLLFHPKIFSSAIRQMLLLFFILLIFLISNKASFIALGLIFVVWILFSKYDVKYKIIGFAGVGAIMVLFLFTNPRAHESMEKIFTKDFVLDKNARYGFSTRLLSWDAAKTLISQKPILGYGLADTQIKLNEVYEEKEYKFPLKESFNAHNLWLQLWLENGVLGIIILISIFYFTHSSGRNSLKNVGFATVLVLLLLTNSFFESMFSRFSGISFFSFIVCFVLTQQKGGSAKE